MAGYGKEESRAPVIVVGAIILLAAIAVAIFMISSMSGKDENRYAVVTEAEPDPAAVEGMINGEKYSGAQNPEGVLSYRIKGEVTVQGGEGDFMMENPPKNTCLMTVTFLLDGNKIYESGYIFPNQHIERDGLDDVPEPGEYTVEVVFEGFDPGTLESLGTSKTEIKMTVE